MNTSQIGLACWGMRELTLAQRLALCNKLGVSFMELGIANAATDLPVDATLPMLEEVRHAFAAANVSLTHAATGNDFTVANSAEIAADIEKLCRVLDICGILGVKYLRIFAGFSPAAQVVDERFERLCQALSTVAAYAQTKAVILALELHGGVEPYADGIRHFHSVSTQEQQLEALMLRLPQQVQFLIDPANLWAVGITQPETYYKLLEGRIAYLHLKDFVPLACGGLLPAACGESKLNWRRFFDSTSNCGGCLMIEYENPEDVEEGMQKSIQFVSSQLAYTEVKGSRP